MHWFGNNNSLVLLAGLVGGFSGLWMPASRGMDAGTPASPPQTNPASPQTAQSPQWGARLHVSPPATASAPKGTAGTPPPAGGPAGEPAPLNIPLVQGYDSFGLSIPDHDIEGRLRSLFVIGAISRVDDRNVEIRESFLETYAADGSPELSIELPKAMLDRFTRVLVAKTPVTLRKAEFELKGASLEFNTLTKEGGLGGPVQMTIYNGTSASPSQKAAASPPSSKEAKGDQK